VAVLAAAESLEPLRSAPDRAAILCDVDGTLAPIAPRPEGSRVPEETHEALAAVGQRYGLLAFVSGRRALDARRLVGIGEATYIGNHGFELLDAGENEPALDPAIGERAERVRRFADTLDRARLDAVGLRLEDKGPIQALHWRGAPSLAAAELQAKEIAALGQASGLIPRWGRKVLELRPVAGIDKGSAVLRVLQGRGLATALYGGDDVTDLDGFRALRWMESSGRLEHAVCVGVGSEEGPSEIRERADIVVEGTEGFVELLVALVEESD
jgi:trehalose 6-phosphate phosphatase